MCSATLIALCLGLLALLICSSQCAHLAGSTISSNLTTSSSVSSSVPFHVNGSLVETALSPTWRWAPWANLFAGMSNAGPTNSSKAIVSREKSIGKAASVLLARKLGVNAMLSSFIYSLTMIPLFLAIGSVFTPAPHGFNGRRKRALVNESHIYRHLPLMNRAETQRFLSLFETTLLNRKIYNEDCKKYYSCKVFHKAVKIGSFPTLADFEYALLNVFGIVAERFDYKLDLIPTVKMYYEIATNAFKGVSCAHKYPCLREANTTKSNLRNVPSLMRQSSAEWNHTRSSTARQRMSPRQSITTSLASH